MRKSAIFLSHLYHFKAHPLPYHFLKIPTSFPPKIPPVFFFSIQIHPKGLHSFAFYILIFDVSPNTPNTRIRQFTSK